MKALLVAALLALSTGCASAYTTEEPETEDIALEAEGERGESKSFAKLPPRTDTVAATTEKDDVAKVVDPTAPVTESSDTLEITWNRVTSTAEYSLDLQLKTGELIGPCEDVSVLRRRLDFTFRGMCLSGNRPVSLADVLDFRICSAENGDWSRAICTNANWDQVSTAVRIDN